MAESGHDLEPEEVLVDVVSSALNRADLLQRMGLYPGPPMPNEIPGMEFSGVVSAVGERVTATRVGATVMGIVGGGAYAEQLVTHERMLLDIPNSVPLADAAAIPEVFITAFDALVAQGGLTSGRIALVHAGASGVGTAAIQIARAIGARIIVTASTDKVAACEALGADVVVDYRTGDFVEAVKSFTGGRGVDVVYDSVGKTTFDGSLDALAPRGYLVLYGQSSGSVPSLDPARLAKGSYFLTRPSLPHYTATRAELLSRTNDLFEMVTTGRLRVRIDRTFPLAQAADAHRALEGRATTGKVLLVP